MMTRLLSILFLIPFLSTGQQSNGCDGTRYKTPVFTDLTHHVGIEFGESVTLNGVTQTLLMDIYEPQGDALTERPLIVFAHGGSFIQGQREDFAPICEAFSHMGYVTATIDYRLIDALIFDSLGVAEEVYMATSDMKAAIRFFREDAATSNTYKINSNMIFAGGGSAGAIMANHVGYLDAQDSIPAHIQTIIDNNGGLEGNSSPNASTYTSEVQGVINYSGSIFRASWIDSNDPPLFSFHDELDPVVPCGYGSTNTLPFPAYSYGSCEMRTVANQTIDNLFYLIPESSGHVSYLQTDAASVLQQTANFLEAIICNNPIVSTDEITQLDATLTPNPSSGKVTIDASSHIESITVYSSNGTIIKAPFKLMKNGQSAELNFQSSGVYFIQITSANQTATKRLIIE